MKKVSPFISVLTDISLFLFLCSKTFLGNYPFLEYVSLASFLLLSLTRAIVTRSFTLRSKYILWYCVFAVFALSSKFWSLSSSFFTSGAPSIIALATFTIALANYANTKTGLNKVVKMYFIANLIAALKIVVLFALFQGTSASRIHEITGIYFNTVAQTIAFATTIGIYQLLKTKNKYYFLAILPMITAIILSGSRKALLIPIISTSIILFLYLRKRKDFIKYLLILFIATMAIGLIVLLNDGLRVKFIDLFSSLLGQETGDWSINLRNFFTRTGIALWRQHPLIGAGLNNFAYFVKNFTDYTEARYAHNNYIELLSTLGIIGTTLYYWFYAYIVLKLIPKIHKVNHLKSIVAFATIITLAIFEWGIVSYSGVMYNILIFIAFTIAEGKTLEKAAIGQHKEVKNEKA